MACWLDIQILNQTPHEMAKEKKRFAPFFSGGCIVKSSHLVVSALFSYMFFVVHKYPSHVVPGAWNMREPVTSGSWYCEVLC